MGNVCSPCCGNRDDDIFESSESDKTNLLGNPVGKDYRSTSIISNKNPVSDTSILSQQAILNQILEKTANSYIDVPALNAPLESPPVDRTKNYVTEIEAALNKHHNTEKTSLLEDIPQVEKTLSDEPLSFSAREMVKEASSSILSALQSIQVENSENLVIPFDGPKDNK